MDMISYLVMEELKEEKEITTVLRRIPKGMRLNRLYKSSYGQLVIQVECPLTVKIFSEEPPTLVYEIYNEDTR